MRGPRPRIGGRRKATSGHRHDELEWARGLVLASAVAASENWSSQGVCLSASLAAERVRQHRAWRSQLGDSPTSPSLDGRVAAVSEMHKLNEISLGERRRRLGFRDGAKGTHSSRTLMLGELELLLSEARPEMSIADYRKLVVDENVLGKPTYTTREHTVRKLKALYGLEPEIPIFRTLVRLWPLDHDSHPLLALLAGYARDPLLRLLASPVLDAPVGSVVSAPALIAEAERVVPGRFSETNLRAIASRVLSTFLQSGHLDGRSEKRRVRVSATTVAASYAFFLAYLEGFRAQRIFTSVWPALLDLRDDRLPEVAFDAARRGLMDYRQVGNVIELRFPNWLSTKEEQLTRDQ